MESFKVLLIGQPNVGKSSLLNALVGPRVVVSNYPRTTVEITKAKRKFNKTEIEFVDTPGIYSISDRSEEEKITLSNRKIGLGVMGFADMLLKLNVAYNSHKAVVIAEKIMKFISIKAKKKSMELGLKRGSFKNFSKSNLKERFGAMRNATVTTIAPTGTISMIADCSQSIEPIFSFSPFRILMGNMKALNINPVLMDRLEKIGKNKKFLI